MRRCPTDWCRCASHSCARSRSEAPSQVSGSRARAGGTGARTSRCSTWTCSPETAGCSRPHPTTSTPTYSADSPTLTARWVMRCGYASSSSRSRRTSGSATCGAETRPTSPLGHRLVLVLSRLRRPAAPHPPAVAEGPAALRRLLEAGRARPSHLVLLAPRLRTTEAGTRAGRAGHRGAGHCVGGVPGLLPSRGRHRARVGVPVATTRPDGPLAALRP